jgi:hypothetical protein
MKPNMSTKILLLALRRLGACKEGHGHCIAAEDLRTVMAESASLVKALLKFVHVFGVQSAYTALANAHGKIEERLARWLLMAQDRIGEDELILTHEFLSLMLGVRRAGVTVALQHFESTGLISTSRGSITIKDRDGLEESANGLYGMSAAYAEAVDGFFKMVRTLLLAVSRPHTGQPILTLT